MISDPVADAALRGLSDALVGLLDQDATPPCALDDRWTSDHQATRAEITSHCEPCPIRLPCDLAAVATKATSGIWAGRDYTVSTTRNTPTPTKRKASK
ncbi:MAG TPA: WhiB family transcriptional regulator [Aeromicrobium sp.]|nr:WhiB family transcriptional regulator [Aeromicrobium sp.]